MKGQNPISELKMQQSHFFSEQTRTTGVNKEEHYQTQCRGTGKMPDFSDGYLLECFR